jgi:hypothetical protein
MRFIHTRLWSSRCVELEYDIRYVAVNWKPHLLLRSSQSREIAVHGSWTLMINPFSDLLLLAVVS